MVLPRRSGAILAVLALGGCAMSQRAPAYRWAINANERGVMLVHGVAGSDDMDYSFTCSAGRLRLDYALAEVDAPYGTVVDTPVGIVVGHATRTVAARGSFDEGGSPRVEAMLDDPAALLRAMLAARTIATTDRWGSHTAPAPPAATLRQFAKRCGLSSR